MFCHRATDFDQDFDHSGETESPVGSDLNDGSGAITYWYDIADWMRHVRHLGRASLSVIIPLIAQNSRRC